MNLIDRLFGRKNLTQDWTADPSVPLLVDLESCTFCGVAPGMPVELLRHLGPSSNKRPLADASTLVYSNHGFLLFLDAANRLETFDINILAEEDMVAFTGTWSFQGRLVTIESSSTPAQIQMLLGKPDKKDKGAVWPFYINVRPVKSGLNGVKTTTWRM